MNYELAKELKDAGFPQNQDRNALYPRGYVLSGTKAGQKQSEKDRAYPPTLSELIEACGEHFYFLQRDKYGVVSKESQGKWIAVAEMSNEAKTGTGSTPEEAVARLYIALNKP